MKKGSDYLSDAEIEVNHDIAYGLPLSTVLYSLFEYKKNKERGSFFFCRCSFAI